MFRRRINLGFSEKARNFLWPRAGWRRATKYLLHRLGRLPGTPYSIAGGFACGAAVSFTPFVGLHFILGAIWAWLTRANVVSSLIGTAVGNPWTFPFIWVWIYNLGTWMGVGGGVDHVNELDFAHFFGAVFDATLSFDLPYLLDTAAPIWVPMLVGSIPTTIVAWFAVYFSLKPVIAAYHHRRHRRAAARKETTK